MPVAKKTSSASLKKKTTARTLKVAVPKKAVRKVTKKVPLRRKKIITTAEKKSVKLSSQVNNNFKTPKKIYLNYSRVFSGPHQIAKIILTHRLPPNTSVLAVLFIVVFALSIIIANSGNLTAEQEPKVQITKNFPTSRPLNKVKEVTYQKMPEQEPKVLGATSEAEMDALLESAE